MFNIDFTCDLDYMFEENYDIAIDTEFNPSMSYFKFTLKHDCGIHVNFSADIKDTSIDEILIFVQNMKRNKKAVIFFDKYCQSCMIFNNNTLILSLSQESVIIPLAESTINIRIEDDDKLDLIDLVEKIAKFKILYKKICNYIYDEDDDEDDIIEVCDSP